MVVRMQGDASAHPKAEQSARNATVTGTAANLQIITGITVHNYDEHSPN